MPSAVRTRAKSSSKLAVATNPVARISGKRKAPLDDDHRTRDQAPAKSRAAAREQKGVASPAPKNKVINKAPHQVLDMFCFGGGEAGELGFCGEKGTRCISRPRFNPLLAADKAGVVQFSVGGMHTAALTDRHKILTWGVNDQGALGRDTSWEAPMCNASEGDGGDGDDSGDSECPCDNGDEEPINPFESTPTAIDLAGLSDDLCFTQVACTDSATFALTNQGFVYGWGTFRGNQGPVGFFPHVEIQLRPVLIPGLRAITKLACGENHVLALDAQGRVYAWGSGEQHQLGRKLMERHLEQKRFLLPEKVLLPRGIVDIGAGQFHSFAIDQSGDVYAWGLNNFGQTGQPLQPEGTGPDAHLPQLVQSLQRAGKIVSATGGSHHSLAITDRGECLVWGRVDAGQTGLRLDLLPPRHLRLDSRGRPRILIVPTPVPSIDAVWVAAGTDHSIAVGRDGRAYAWGFNSYRQTGVSSKDQVDQATVMDSEAIKERRVVLADCGGQFSVIAALPGDNASHRGGVNGVNGHV